MAAGCKESSEARSGLVGQFHQQILPHNLGVIVDTLYVGYGGVLRRHGLRTEVSSVHTAPMLSFCTSQESMSIVSAGFVQDDHIHEVLSYYSTTYIFACIHNGAEGYALRVFKPTTAVDFSRWGVMMMSWSRHDLTITEEK